jgi:acetyl esterase
MMDAALAAGGKPVAELPLATAREAYSQRYRDRSLPAPAGVGTEDITIPTKDGSLAARLYKAEGASGDLPLLVYFHGGGFVLGDAPGYEGQSKRLAKDIGCAVLFPEYRLAPEHPFPAALSDAMDTLTWAQAHAKTIGIDPSRIAVAGDSAGGNLAANMAIASRNGRVPKLTLQVLLYPVTDYRGHFGFGPKFPSREEFAKGFWLDRTAQEWFARSYLQRREDADDSRTSVLLQKNLGGLPPALVITAAYDPLRDEGEAYAKQMEAAGVPVTYWCIDGMIHNFLGHTAKSAAARAAFDRIAAEIRRQLSA